MSGWFFYRHPLLKKSVSLLNVFTLAMTMVLTGLPAFSFKGDVRPAAAAPVVLDNKANASTWVANGGVFASATATDGTTYIGGNFTYVGPNTGSGAPISTADGSRAVSFPKVSGAVYSVISDDAGGWYIGGDFTKVGAYTRTRLAHILSDGSVDPAWNPSAGGRVRALAKLGSTVYAGGDFLSVNGGTARWRLAAFDVTTGTVTSWMESGGTGASVNALAVVGSTIYIGGGFVSIGVAGRNYVGAVDTSGTVLPWNPNVNSTVQALAVDTATVYAGGSFTTVNGGTSRSRMAAFDDTTGTATSWNPSGGAATNSNVYTLMVNGDYIYVGGAFTFLAGVSRNYLGAISKGGVIDSWNPNANNAVTSLVTDGANVYAGGYFTQMGGQTRNHLAAVSLGNVLQPWNPNSNGTVVWAMARSGSTVFAGGDFTSVNGVDRNRLAALDASGSATAWNPNANSIVHAMTLKDSNVYIGGLFTTLAGGGYTRNRAAAISTTGTVTAWNPNASGGSNAIYTVASDPSTSTIYAGGSFTTIGGQGQTNLAGLDPTTGLVISGWYGISPNSSVRALKILGSKVYVGGSFTVLGPQVRNYLGAINLNGTLDTTWNPNVNAQVYGLGAIGSTVYAGGNFTSVKGGAYSRDRLAAFDVSTDTPLPWNPGANSQVNALAAAGSTVYAGGFFTAVGGKARNYLAALDAVEASGTATAWNPNPNSFGNYSSINVAGSSVFAAGDFVTMNGEAQSYFARFDPDVLPPNTICATNPATPSGDNGWYKGPAPTINLTPDESGTTYYQWDTSTPGNFNLYGAPLTPAQGSSDLYYYSADGNNNTETVKSQSLKVDSGLPTDPSVSSPTHTTGTVTNDNFIAVDISGATDSVSGVAGFGTSWTNSATTTPDATITLPAAATSTVSGPLGDGTWWFHLRTKDTAGNWTSTVHLGPFGIDSSAPAGTVQIEGGAQFTNNPVAELDISSPDAAFMRSAETTSDLLLALYKPYATTDTVLLTGADGPKSVFTQFKDLADNESTPATDAIVLDTGLPGDPDTVLSTSHTTATPSNDKTIDMTFSDPFDGLSGVEGYAITFSEGTTELPLPPVNHVYTGADSTTSPELYDGTWWFNLRTQDRAGNWTSTVHVGPYLIEAEPPVTTIEATPATDGDNGWYKNNPAITFTTNESATTYYSWDDSASVTTTFTAPLSIPSDGEHELFYRSVDIASNEETAQIAFFKLDPTAPVDPDLASPTHATDTPNNSNAIQIDINGANDPVSGVEGYSGLWSPDSTTPPQVMNLTASGGIDTTTSAPLSDGPWWFNLSTKDMAGNWTNTAHIGPFVIDTSAPVSFFTGPANGSAHIRPHGVYISGTATDTVGSGLADTKLSIKRLSDDAYWDGGAWGPYAEINVGSGGTWDYNMPAAAFEQSGGYLATVQATDLAGNTQGAPSMTTFNYLDGSVVPSAGLRVLTMDNSDTIAARVVRTNTGPFDPTAGDLSLASPAYPADTTITVELNTGGRNALAVLAHGDPIGWEQNGDTLTVEAKTIAYKPTTATPAFDLESALEFLVQYSGDPALQDSWFASNASQQNVPVPDLSDLDSLRLQVTGVGGVDGWAKAFLPTATLAAWETTASLLSIEIDGVQTTPTITPVAGGAIVDIQLGYSTHTLRYGEDRVPPSGAVAINNNDTHANSTLIEMTIDATDGVGSGVAEMRFAETTTALAGAVYQPQDTTAAFNLDLGDGTRTVYAQFKDEAGNESAPTADTIILDTTGPSGSVAINSGAQYTNDPVVGLDLSSPDAIFMQSAETTAALLLGTLYKPYSTTDTIALTGADGVKTVFTQFKDIAGNESTPVADTIILDTNTPDESGVSVASTPATGTPTNDNTVELSFSGATDTVSGVAGYSVLFNQSPSTTPPQTVNLVGSGGDTTETTTSGPLGEGSNYAHLSTKDNAGNWTSTVHIGPFAIDTGAPSGTVVANDNDIYTIDNLIQLSVSATDTTGSGVTGMRFSQSLAGLDATTYSSYNTTAAFSFSVGDGTKTVYVQFKDAAGNESAPAADTIILDTVGPSGTVLINSDSTFTKDATVALDISAVDGGSGLDLMRFAETTAGLSSASYNSYNATATFNLIGADGAKTVFAQFKDVAGNESSDLYFDAITLDTSAPVDPTVVSSSGHATDTASNNNVITMALSGATDSLSGVEGFSAEWSTDTPVTPDNTVDLPASASSTSSPTLADGDWYFNLRTKDNAGNWTSTVHEGPYKIDTTDPANPTSAVEDGGAADNTWQNAVSDPAFTLTGASDTSGSGIKSFRYYFGTNAAADPTSEDSASFYNPTAVENPSVYYLRVKTEDNAGNVSDAATLFTFKYDGQDPTDPTIASPSHTAGGWSNDGTIDVNLSGATDGSGSGIDGYSYSFTAGSSDVPDQTKEIEEGATSFTSSSLGEGAWYAHLRTRDNAGNWTSTRHIGPFYIDKTAPTATVTSTKISTNESKTKSFNVTWSGADAGGSGIASYDVQVKVGKSGAWANWKTGTTATSAVYTGSPGKTYYFHARATDGAGNTGAWSAESKTIVPFDNNSLIKSKVGFGSTVSAAKTKYFLGTARYSTKGGDEITYVFTGNHLSLIGNKGPKYSKAEVTIDGVKKTIDAKAGSLKFRQVLLSKTWTAIKKHTVKIKNLGTAGRTRFDIDGLGVGK